MALDPKYLSPDFVHEFIRLYRQHECLWRLGHDDYNNKEARDLAYKDMVDFCRQHHPEVDEDFVKTKINSLRSSFRKELRKVNASRKKARTPDDVYKPRLWYFQDLMFTAGQRASSHSSAVGNVDRTDEEGDDESMELTSIIVTPDIITGETEEDEEKSKNVAEPPSKRRKRKVSRSSSLPTNNFVKNEPFCNEMMNMNSAMLPRMEADEFDHFGFLVAAKMRRLAADQKLYAENIINKTLFLAMTQQLTSCTENTLHVNPLCCSFGHPGFVHPPHGNRDC